jgi:Fe-S cluster biogenesis protein NfuA
MAADDRQELVQALRRLEELIVALEAHPEAAASVSARELVSLVLNLHGIGLAKLMAILAKSEGGAASIARLAEDDNVRAMLLLHGLHPDDLETRVVRAVERLRPHLAVCGIRVEILGITRGIVQLRLHPSGGIAVKASILLTLPDEIEDAIVEAAPDIEKVLIDGFHLKGGVGAQNMALTEGIYSASGK